jgi:hypothetical protein
MGTATDLDELGGNVRDVLDAQPDAPPGTGTNPTAAPPALDAAPPGFVPPRPNRCAAR